MRNKWIKRVLPILAVILVLAVCTGIFYKSTTEDSLKDETYFPEFSFTGGTGKVSISCEQVVLKDGQATAEIVFDSPNYTWVKVEGVQYDNQTPGEASSVFEIPVNPEGITEIIAQTTAMSVPHEIEYQLSISISGNVSEDQDANSEEELIEKAQKINLKTTDIEQIPEISGLAYSHSINIEYAECFRIYCYEGGYEVIRINDGRNYLLIPENGEIPEGLSEEYVILKKPLNNIYLVATSSMAMVDSIGALNQVRLTGTKAENWYVENAKAAMEKGDILFAGKYSAPDYELLISENCSLAIESTMILHSPEVQEKLEEMGIPVLVERSSYENHPLGRTEWLKLYGELTGKSAEAEKAFEVQKDYVLALEDFENTEKTVAFFYINQNGIVVTRKSSDYVPAMIELAGGRYIFENLGDSESASSAVNLTMEEFYAAAKDADYLIYNGTIDNPLNSVEDLLSKSDLFEDFRAVKEGNVWSTDKYLYQASNENGQVIQDFHVMLTDASAQTLKFIYRLK